MPTLSRRQILAALTAVSARPSARAADDPWSAVATILARIKAPVFPARDFDITRYGAKSDGKTDSSDAFRKAIDAAAQAGGGRVHVREGVFLTGALRLKSNVNLHVAKGATVRFIPDPKLYPIVLTRFEGLECMNYSPFVYALDQRNIAITGEGTLDGQASCDHWWPWSGKRNCGATPGTQREARARLLDMAEKGVPVEKRVMGDGAWLRPMFVQPYRCQNVLIEGVTIVNSPMYEMHPVLCRNVTVKNVTVSSHGPNNDGCDPESSADVLIDGCTFDTGDDCIAIKSGRNADGRRLHTASENIIVQNCIMKDGHGGVSIGSEVSGGIRNIHIQRCRMSSPHLQRALRIKTNSYRGGVIENISFRDITVGQVAEAAIEVDFYYEEGEGGPFRPVVRNIDVQNVTCEKSKHAIFMRGYPAVPITGVTISNCSFNHASEDTVLQNVKSVSLKDVTVNGKKIAR